MFCVAVGKILSIRIQVNSENRSLYVRTGRTRRKNRFTKTCSSLYNEDDYIGSKYSGEIWI